MNEVIYREHTHLSVYVAIYERHYMKLVRDPHTHEWLRIERVPYIPHKVVHDTEHVVNRAMTSDYKDLKPLQFWGLLQDALGYIHKYYHVTPL